MYNPNDISINPNADGDQPATHPQPNPTTGSAGGTSGGASQSDATMPQSPVSSPSNPSISDEGFDLDAALESLEEPTPTPDPDIEVNPRNAEAVAINHREDIQHNRVAPTAPTPPQATQQPTPPQTSHTTTTAEQLNTPTPTIAGAPSVHPPHTTPLPTNQSQNTSTMPKTPSIPPIPSSPAKEAVHQAFGVGGPTQPATPASPGVPSTPKPLTKPGVPRTINTKKKGKRIGIVGYAIGCGLFLFLMLGGGALLLWSMFQDPNQTRQWIDRSAGEQLLKIFAGTIFAIFTLFGAFFFFINLFRLSSKKNTKKITYIGGMLLGFVLMSVGLGAGIPAISKLNNLSSQTYNSGLLVTPYVVLGNNEGLRSLADPKPPLLIAPTEIVYVLDVTIYNTLKGQRGLQQDPILSLDCGNGQVFALNTNNNTPSFGPCFYTEKKTYDVTVLMSYIDRATGQQVEEEVPISNLTLNSAIGLTNTDGTKSSFLELNQQQTELIAGVAPAKVSLDAQGVITDYQLPTNNIKRDMDNDGEFERLEDVVFSQNYLQSRLHTISYQLPDLSPYTYSFDLRVQQSDVPICRVSIAPTSPMTYQFAVDFVESNVGISQYGFEIINTANNRSLDKQSSAMNTLMYDFVREGSYAVKAYFITDDGNKGSCQSDDFRVGAVPYTISYTPTIQGPDESTPKDPSDSDVIKITDDNSRVISSIPAKISLRIDDIIPRVNTVVPVVLLDDEPQLSPDNKRFSFKIDTVGEHTIQIGARDELTNETSIIHTIRIRVELPAVEGQLVIHPDNVGDEPFKVTLDASTVTLNDADDEVVYFSRDFGDGETKRNQSQGRIQHTYYFDKDTQEGIYHPTATITTRKGRTLTLELSDPVTVKRALRHAEIIFDSHPAQLAGVGENVVTSLIVDGIPDTVVWDFGDGETFQCTGRTCNEITHNFLTPGNYTITATITYEDHPDVTATSTIIIQ